MKKFIKRSTIRGNSAGDTIVEVLIVLTILSLAFVISYATATKGLSKTRSAEEHSQTLGILNGQVELLRHAANNPDSSHPLPLPGTPFCMNNLIPVIIPAPPGAFDPATSNHAGCKTGTFYNMSIVAGSDGTYVLRVNWDGAGGLGRQQEQFTYRVKYLPNEGGHDPGTGTSAPQIKVTVKPIRPNPDFTTPACTNSADPANNKAGTTVEITQDVAGATPQSKTTTNNSIALFQGLNPGTYTAKIQTDHASGVSSVPAGYKACPENNPTATPLITQPNVVTSVSMKIQPQCKRVPAVHNYTTTERVEDPPTRSDQPWNYYGDPLWWPISWYQGTGNQYTRNKYWGGQFFTQWDGIDGGRFTTDQHAYKYTDNGPQDHDKAGNTKYNEQIYMTGNVFLGYGQPYWHYGSDPYVHYKNITVHHNDSYTYQDCGPDYGNNNPWH